MELIWSGKGAEFNSTPEQQAAILTAVRDLEWHDLGPGLVNAPAMQGLALQQIIRTIGGRHVTVAWGAVLQERYDILAVETWYRNGEAVSYWLDLGTKIIPLYHTFETQEDWYPCAKGE